MRLRAWLLAAALLGPAACVGDDSSAIDGGGSNDGGTDAATAFCATHTSATTIICADFDGPSLDAGWTTTAVSGGGALSLESNDVVSQPNALVAAIPSSGTAVSAMLQLDPVGAPAAFSGALRLQVKVPACFQGTDVITIASLQFFASSSVIYQVDLGVGIDGGVFVSTQNFAQTGPSGVSSRGANQLLPLNVWTDMELDLTTSGTPHANLVQNGQVVLGTDLVAGNAPGTPRLMLGARADKLASSTCAIQFDNVTLDRQ